MSETNLPPPPFSPIITLGASSIIDAPIEKVWDVLVDFPSYGEWNDMVHAQTIVDEHKKPLDSQILQEGRHLLMEVHIPPTSDRSHKPTSHAFELITNVDHAAHRVCWVSTYPRWFIEAVRWQTLSPVDGEEGKTKYESREVFRGIGSWILRWFLAGGLQQGFDACAQGLKRRAEQVHQT
ncbi:hypothetical protein SCP_1002180 [Sparassis crispa]|uniref:Coenzyme Q-binding protein COQ10 START domain-containing protein n=1 Tax=Sparassis crispa TaxID=139825 RepID=A0A401GXP8_9APHY|nr:hypothetical protein SCP_1002180 [Sparassis crispa]GBE86973.1 hypothetical protein SCP_1002180 [Sparassis crispa]